MAALDFELTLAHDDDAQPLATFARDLIETGLGWSYQPQRLASLIDDPDIVTLVARERGAPIGFAAMRFGDTRAHLILLAVQSTHQRRGIARSIVEWLLDSARDAGITPTTMAAVMVGCATIGVLSLWLIVRPRTVALLTP